MFSRLVFNQRLSSSKSIRGICPPFSPSNLSIPGFSQGYSIFPRSLHLPTISPPGPPTSPANHNPPAPCPRSHHHLTQLTTIHPLTHDHSYPNTPTNPSSLSFKNPLIFPHPNGPPIPIPMPSLCLRIHRTHLEKIQDSLSDDNSDVVIETSNYFERKVISGRIIFCCLHFGVTTLFLGTGPWL